jgi:hypothetical protein
MDWMSISHGFNLESFHLMLAHFGNSGMRDSLADNLNLTGTAWYNLSIRYKLQLAREESTTKRSRIPAAWETVVSYFNHSELSYINTLAKAAGMQDVPFVLVEALGKDTGERFFSGYLDWLATVQPKTDPKDMCLCSICSSVTLPANIMPAKTMPPTPNRDDVPSDDADENQQSTSVIAATAITVVEPTIVARQQLPFYQPLPLPPIPHMNWLNPYTIPFPQWSAFCCEKYKDYCFQPSRRGRPPHNNKCRNKNAKIV